MPKIDEVWEAKIKFWPEDEERHMLVIIYYVWADGRIQFIPALCYEGDPIWVHQCAQVKWIRKVGNRNDKERIH